ncbi:MAG: FG-GAP repeat protein [Planctomycetes bacterium]|nr:FG-GAP repeat protein [Planctomycetota bacterium]
MSGQITRALIRAALASFLLCGAARAQGVLHAFHGDTSGDSLGTAVDGAGDVDQDGFPDLLAGAPYDDLNGADSGSVMVYSGLNGALLFVFAGDAAGDRLGSAARSAGDVNNDGVPDLVAGAPLDDDNGTSCGSARVYSGLDGSVLFTFHGDSAGDECGRSAAGAGDINNDGFADVIAGAHLDAPAGAATGSARVFSGNGGSVLLFLAGDSAGDWFGRSVSGAGDVNADGRDDVIAGAPFDDNSGTNSGSARVFSGLTGAPLYTFNGDGAGDLFGFSASGAGHVNQDGCADLVAGAYADDNMGTDSGSARILSGQNGSVRNMFNGDTAGDEFGCSVSAAGDVNADGFADVIAGAHRDDDNGFNCGTARVLSGQDGSILLSVAGTTNGEFLGCAVGAAGDVNGDGFDDVIGGAYGARVNGASSGAARVFSATCGSAAGYGSGCAGSGGFIPQIALAGCPTPGGSVTFSLDQGLGGALSLLFVSASQASIPIGGGVCTVNVSMPIPIVLALPLLSGSGGGAGALALDAVLPLPSALGTFVMQAVVCDPGAALGFSASAGLEVEIR